MTAFEIDEPKSATYPKRVNKVYVEDKVFSQKSTYDTISEEKIVKMAMLNSTPEGHNREGRNRDVHLEFESSDFEESSEEFDIKKDIMINESSLY